jgi:hypothetical protein
LLAMISSRVRSAADVTGTSRVVAGAVMACAEATRYM